MTSSSTKSSVVLVRKRRTADPASSGIGAISCLAAKKCDSVPVQVVGQPLPQLEVALPRRPITPRSRDLRDPPAGARGLHRELERQLEAGRALDADRVEEGAAVELEIARRIASGDPGEPVER